MATIDVSPGGVVEDAINSAVSGDTVRLLNGVHQMGHTKIPVGVSVVGESRTGTIIQPSGSARALYYSFEPLARSMFIVGVGTGQRGGSRENGLNQQIGNFTIDGLNMLANGISVHRRDNVLVRDFTIKDCHNGGIALQATTNTTVRNFSITDCSPGYLASRFFSNGKQSKSNAERGSFIIGGLRNCLVENGVVNENFENRVIDTPIGSVQKGGAMCIQAAWWSWWYSDPQGIAPVDTTAYIYDCTFRGLDLQGRPKSSWRTPQGGYGANICFEMWNYDLGGIHLDNCYFDTNLSIIDSYRGKNPTGRAVLVTNSTFNGDTGFPIEISYSNCEFAGNYIKSGNGGYMFVDFEDNNMRPGLELSSQILRNVIIHDNVIDLTGGANEPSVLWANMDWENIFMYGNTILCRGTYMVPYVHSGNSSKNIYIQSNNFVRTVAGFQGSNTAINQDAMVRGQGDVDVRVPGGEFDYFEPLDSISNIHVKDNNYFGFNEDISNRKSGETGKISDFIRSGNTFVNPGISANNLPNSALLAPGSTFRGSGSTEASMPLPTWVNPSTNTTGGVLNVGVGTLDVTIGDPVDPYTISNLSINCNVYPAVISWVNQGTGGSNDLVIERQANNSPNWPDEAFPTPGADQATQQYTTIGMEQSPNFGVDWDIPGLYRYRLSAQGTIIGTVNCVYFKEPVYTISSTTGTTIEVNLSLVEFTFPGDEQYWKFTVQYSDDAGSTWTTDGTIQGVERQESYSYVITGLTTDSNFLVRILPVLDATFEDGTIINQSATTATAIPASTGTGASDCSMAINSITPSTCIAGTYDLTINCTITNPDSSDVRFEVKGVNYTFNTVSSGVNTFIIQNLICQGGSNLVVTGDFVGDASCTAVSTYTEPNSPACSIVVSGSTSPCNSSDQTTLTLNINYLGGISNIVRFTILGIPYDRTISGTGSDQFIFTGLPCTANLETISVRFVDVDAGEFSPLRDS